MCKNATLSKVLESNFRFTAAYGSSVWSKVDRDTSVKDTMPFLFAFVETHSNCISCDWSIKDDLYGKDHEKSYWEPALSS